MDRPPREGKSVSWDSQYLKRKITPDEMERRLDTTEENIREFENRAFEAFHSKVHRGKKKNRGK